MMAVESVLLLSPLFWSTPLPSALDSLEASLIHFALMVL